MKKVLIIGAGPAGLTAAYELLKHPGFQVVVLEEDAMVGGIARTVVYKGNRIDIGGHRFFSKSDKIMLWWQKILPLQGAPASDDLALGRKVPLSEAPGAPDPEKVDPVMLSRQRVSRILYFRALIDYPVSLNWQTLRSIGFLRMLRIVVSYLLARIHPIRFEKSLEDFMVNRFGRELYRSFFEDYTHKVWGRHPAEIKRDWGAQRIKGISISAVLAHAWRSLFYDWFRGGRSSHLSAQNDLQTSLIGQFLYPKLGPGQLWETVAENIVQQGGKIHLHKTVDGMETEGAQAVAVTTRDQQTGARESWTADYFLSTMPVKDLVEGMTPAASADIRSIAGNLPYRDFIMSGLLCRKLTLQNTGKRKGLKELIPDHWIYIQESDVKIGRLQIFNNWSPYMVSDPDTVWVGVEYFCQEGDDLWRKTDQDFRGFAAGELVKIGVIDPADILDGVVIRVKKAYPAYFEGYQDFSKVRAYLDGFKNLFLMGRNGMHRYNNMDHSMLAAMACVENIVAGRTSKENIWAVNTAEEYQ